MNARVEKKIRQNLRKTLARIKLEKPWYISRKRWARIIEKLFKSI